MQLAQVLSLHVHIAASIIIILVFSSYPWPRYNYCTQGLLLGEVKTTMLRWLAPDSITSQL